MGKAVHSLSEAAARAQRRYLQTLQTPVAQLQSWRKRRDHLEIGVRQRDATDSLRGCCVDRVYMTTDQLSSLQRVWTTCCADIFNARSLATSLQTPRDMEKMQNRLQVRRLRQTRLPTSIKSGSRDLSGKHQLVQSPTPK